MYLAHVLEALTNSGLLVTKKKSQGLCSLLNNRSLHQTFTSPLFSTHCGLLSSYLKSDIMAKSDSSDDENDSIFDVEEIVQMFVTDNGERMFEIKWKGYPPE